jgi:hypothetical protein
MSTSVNPKLAGIAYGVQAFLNYASFPASGADEVLYLDLSTGDLYYWNGTSYQVTGGAFDEDTILTGPAAYLYNDDVSQLEVLMDAHGNLLVGV